MLSGLISLWELTDLQGLAIKAYSLKFRPEARLSVQVGGCKLGTLRPASFGPPGPDSSRQDAALEKLGTRDRLSPSLPWYWVAANAMCGMATCLEV